MDRIIYPLNDDTVAIIVPTGALSIEQVAKKDVPAGVPYKFVSLSDIPVDRYFRGAWESDFSNPDGYGIGQDAWATEQEILKNDHN